MLPTISRATERTPSSTTSETVNDSVVETTMTSRGNQTFFRRPPLPMSVYMLVVTLLAKNVHGRSPHSK